MGIIRKLLGRGDEDVDTVKQVNGGTNRSQIQEEPVHDWFSEDAYDEKEEIGVHSDTSPDYSQALENMDGKAFKHLDAAGMSVSDEMRQLVQDSYRIVEIDNGEESVRAAYLDWEDNVDEAFSDLLWQETFRNEEGNLTVTDYSVERAVDMMYDEVQDINDELRAEGVDVIGGRRNSTVKASARASRYDDRSCMSNNSMIGWGEPGINAHVSFSIKEVDRNTLHVGSRDYETKKKIKEEVQERMDFYNGRAYDSEGTVEEIAEELGEVFDGQEEVEVTVDQMNKTGRVDRFMDDTVVYEDESFTYETTDREDFRRTNLYDTGLREFDQIAQIIERENVHNYQEA